MPPAHPRFALPVAAGPALLATFLMSLLVSLLAPAVPAQAATTRVPPTPTGLPTLIEPFAPYVEQVACDPTVRPGTRNLARLLADTYRGFSATSWNSTYACGTDGNRSEHYDGRAIDWMVDVHNSGQYAAARAALGWLLRADAAGNRAAMARRLGVMYLIYNNRMWGSWDGQWHDYNGCGQHRSHAYDNSCHRTHMHISLSWNGAMGRTSYWTKRVAPTDYGPCRVRDLNWAARYRRATIVPCPDFSLVTARRSDSAVKKDLVTYSGAAVRHGWDGPAVSAVQRALRVSATGHYGDATVAAVRRFQTRHHLTVTGAMNPPTWRALLAAVR